NVDRSLAQIIFYIAFETDHLDVVAPEFFQVRPGFIMHGADQPKLGVFQVEAMPCLENVVNPFPLNQRAGKNRAENRRPRAWFEPFHVYAPRQVIKFFFRESLDAKSVGRLLGKNEEHVREIVFLDKTLAGLEQAFLPTARRFRRRTGRSFARDFSPIPMPGRNLHDGGNAELARDAQRLEAIARPTMEEIVTAGGEMARRDPIEIFFFRPVVIRPVEERDQADRMPAQRIDEPRRDLTLPVIVSDGAAEKTAAMR